MISTLNVVLAGNNKSGITSPVSVECPNEAEIKQNERFLEVLQKVSSPDSEEDRKRQESVLGEINAIYKNWLKSLVDKNELKDFEHTAPLIYTYGSFRLGVHEKGADIDTLLIGPCNVTHEMFFGELCDSILSKHEKITNFSMVKDAFVPLAKFEFDGIPIDLIYAQTSFEILDERFDIHSDEVMRAVTPQTIRSLNGVRVTDMLLELVPDEKVFRNVVRFLKFWAKKRGIYGNVMGYMGGVSYSIMAGRICQLYPKGNEFVIIRQFYSIYNLWHWPTPICLKHIRSEGPGDHVVWTRDANLYDRMPVITPAYPAQNSTYNITFSNFTFLKEEIERGREILSDKEMPADMFTKLAEENSFFASYKHFFQIRGDCNENESFTGWFGWIESRVRKFVSILEENLCFTLVPFPKQFTEPSQKGTRSAFFYIGSKIAVFKNDISQSKTAKRKKINITPSVQKFTSHINAFKNRTKSMKIKVDYLSRSKLPDFLFDADNSPKRGAKKRKRLGDP